ncbi:juvenile hormone esterase-like isoform X2 [Ostrinia furnacalis]|uniref:juvenile hormone esterase-like isoform X2 n=1 Tax=Ostrinia furnacalis TaxID=93504 RepID=UPI00103E461D|nr:juvenile hormone esterase-like isoform X2 [Ostrinia furnacalis]
MPAHTVSRALAAYLLCGAVVSAAPEPELRGCGVAARTQGGWVCGARRIDAAGAPYASFRGVPYAKQPLGELRFQELQQVDSWTGVLNATAEGPVCPQSDVVYQGLQTHAGGMSEACIHANVHAPLAALPPPSASDDVVANRSGLPILVFIHGGGFAFGSGDTDLYGPEYLVNKGVIVITFNYRLNVFGFLSLGSASVPGNNGLRDCVTLLRWVRANARRFGGDPARVTLAGQSAGAALAHLLALSPAAKGLFQRVALLSGTGNSEFFSTSPAFAQLAAGLLLGKLGVPAEPEEAHRRLVAAPLPALMAAHSELLELFGLSVFAPVVEAPHPGVIVLDEDPDVLIAKGRGRDIPHLIGFTSAECETFRPRLRDINIEKMIAGTEAVLLTPKLTYQTPPATAPSLIAAIQREYFNESISIERFIAYCSDAYYAYPAMKLAERRAAAGRTYLYRFAYPGQRSPVKEALQLNFTGAGHIEDMTYVFRANAVLGPPAAREPGAGGRDDEMRARMTDYLVNFMRDSEPASACSWPEVTQPLQLKDISAPGAEPARALSEEQTRVLAFFDGLHRAAAN